MPTGFTARISHSDSGSSANHALCKPGKFMPDFAQPEQESFASVR